MIVAASAAATHGGAKHGFSAEEEAALQWVLEKKDREPTRVCAFPPLSESHRHAFLQLSFCLERQQEGEKEAGS